MVPEILRFAAESLADELFEPGSVLEVGSLDINGSIRSAIQPRSTSYTGIDLSPGPGVDRILSGHEIGQVWQPATFDTVACCEMLEHDLRPWITVAQLHAVLKQGGTLLITTPTFGFPLHRFPKDYYRFGEDAFREFIFDGFEILRLKQIADTVGSPIICCIGRKK